MDNLAQIERLNAFIEECERARRDLPQHYPGLPIIIIDDFYGARIESYRSQIHELQGQQCQPSPGS